MTDSDVTLMWKEFKKMKQDARTQRRENAPEILHKARIPFTEHNNGAHLILDTHLGFVDFWPGTSKWKTRDPIHSLSGHTLTKLLQLIQPEFAK